MLTIYLADLTHTTITITSDVIPLNIGWVGAYIKEKYPDVQIELFRYPDTLKQALDKKLPDILACSNYPWNKNLGMAFFDFVKKQNKNIITAMGGPNISYNRELQYEFLERHRQELDFYCMYEGETSFENLLIAAMAQDFDIEKMKQSEIPGNIYLKDRSREGIENMSEFIKIARNKTLEDYPSPYLSGILDKFFDGVLTPMMETHRGCPFRCTFCHEGHMDYAKVNRFPPDRVVQEFEYIADRVGDKVSNLMIADPNFGMYTSDIEFAKIIKETQERTGFPRHMFATTAKNKKENLVEISRTLKNRVRFPIFMSAQSLTENVLENIKRRNISIDHMIAVQRELEEHNVNSTTELILSLPGETYESHMDTLMKVIRLKINNIIVHQLMMVNGSEMASDEETRSKFKFQYKYRITARSFTAMEGLRKAIETEQIVVATKDMSFEDYLNARRFHLVLSIFYNANVFSGFYKLIDEYELDRGDFLLKLDDIVKQDKRIRDLLSRYLEENQTDLFEEEEDIHTYYESDEHFKKLTEGGHGSSLLQKFTSESYMDQSDILIDLIYEAALHMKANDENYRRKLEDIRQFYRLSFLHYLDADRVENESEGSFVYDIPTWLQSQETLDSCQFEEETTIVFYTPEENFRLVEDYFDRFGRNPQAFGKISTRLWIFDMLRKARVKVTV